MNQIDYSKHLEKYIVTQTETFDKLSTRPLASFSQLEVNTHRITQKYYLDCIEELQTKGFNKNSTVLYYFQLQPPFSVEEIHGHVMSMKSKIHRVDRSFPKINHQNNFDTNNILYVGKTNKNFFSRLKQHMGLASKSTYALHLNAWKKDLNLTLHIMPSTLDLTDIEMLEHMESVFHFALKPLLGRSGH